MCFTLDYWLYLCKVVGCSTGDPRTFYYQILDMYRENRYTYHSFQSHVDPGFEHLDHWLSLATFPEEREPTEQERAWTAIAWGCHDIMLGVEQSAMWTRRMLEKLGANPVAPLMGQALVKSTRHDFDERYPLSQVICDVDLLPLAVPWEEFHANFLRIREEYPGLTDQEYYAQRAEVLGKFAKRKKIYYLKGVQGQHESPARYNITRMIEEISACYPLAPRPT